MSDTKTFTFRLDEPVRDRVEALAAYSGCTPSEWMRRAIAFTDTSVVLSELRAAERANGGLSDRQREVLEEATDTLVELAKALGPKPLPFNAALN